MNRQEQRELREIEKKLAAEDPALAELLRPSTAAWRRHVVCALACLAAPFTFLGLVLGDALLLLMAGMLASIALLGWVVQAVLSDGFDRYWR